MTQEVTTTTTSSTINAPQNGQSDDQEEKAKEKAKAAHEQDIYNNFATPLMGTFLNLPREPVTIKCPACGITALSQVENDPKWWATEINNIVGCLFITFCCCCCFNYIIPCKQTDRNHYCINCGCYFGRVMKYKPIKPKAPKNSTQRNLGI